MYKKILLPMDGSECAERAGGHAIWTSNVSGADIVVLYVVDTYFLRSAYLPNFRGELYDSLQKEGEKVVERFRKNLEESQCEGLCKGVKLKTEVTGGKPYEEILDTIKREKIDVVFMGSTGRHGRRKIKDFSGSQNDSSVDRRKSKISEHEELRSSAPNTSVRVHQKSKIFDRLSRVLLGGTTDRVLRSAKVPVVVVP